jgi:hypothetical protein
MYIVSQKERIFNYHLHTKANFMMIMTVKMIQEILKDPGVVIENIGITLILWYN